MASGWHEFLFARRARRLGILISAFFQVPGVPVSVENQLLTDLNGRYRRIIDRCNVQLIDQFLSEPEMEALFSSADIYVLPAARLHVVSVLQWHPV